MSITVFIPGLVVKTPNGSHGHWTRGYSRSKLHRQTAALMLRDSRTSVPEPPLVVTLTRRSPLMLDDDNAVAAFKHVRDGVADWLGINDRDPRVTWRVEQRKSKRGEAGTEIRIERRQ